MKKKSLLALLLVLAMTVTAYAETGFSGSSVGGTNGGIRTVTVVRGSPHASSYTAKGWYVHQFGSRDSIGSTGIRMRAFPLTNSPRQEYFYKDDTTKEVSLLTHDELVNAAGYSDINNWHMFCNAKRVYRPAEGDPSGEATRSYREAWQIGFAFYDTYQGGVMSRSNSDDYRRLLRLCGKDPMGDNRSWEMTDPDIIDMLFRDNPYFKDDPTNEHRKQLGMEYFGLTEEEAESFYIVVEEFKYLNMYYVYKSDGSKYQVSYKFDNKPDAADWDMMITETLATYTSKDEGSRSEHRAKLLFGVEAGQEAYKQFKDMSDLSRYPSILNTITWTQGADAPFEGYHMREFNDTDYTRNNVVGYSLYSFGDMVPESPAGNIAVEYTGDVGVTAPSDGDFVGAGSLIKGTSGDEGVIWDFQNSKFVEVDGYDKILRFESIDVGDEYSLCFAGAGQFTVQNENSKLLPETEQAFVDAPTHNHTLEWGKFLVDHQPVNIGYTWKIASLDGYTNVIPLAERFETAYNSVSGINGTLHRSSFIDTTERLDEESSVLNACFINYKDYASRFSERDCFNLESKSFIKDKKVGMGLEFIIRGNPVMSRKVTYTVTADRATMQVVSCSGGDETWRDNYTTVSSTECPIDGEAVAWVVVPGYDSDGAVGSAVAGVTQALAANYLSAMTGAADTKLRDYTPTVIGLGSTEDEPPTGYTVYEVLIEWLNPETPVTGAVELPAYMLNKYFDNIIQTSSALKYGTPCKYYLNRDWTWQEWTAHGYCKKTGAYVGPTAYKKNWVIEYYDAAGGDEFGYDNGMIDRYYPEGTGNWSSSVRHDLHNAWSISMDTEHMPVNTYRVDYAFNLIREIVGDKRSISGVSAQTYNAATGDSQNLLRISSEFGVVPKTVKPASTPRMDLSNVGVYTEQFNIKSRYQLTASATGNHTKTNRHGTHTWTEYCGSENCSGHTRSCTIIWYSLIPSTCQGFVSNYGGSCNTIDYAFQNAIHKYTTLSMPIGLNDYLNGANSRPLSDYARKGAEHVIHGATDAYRFATVRATSASLKYYPENYMVFRIGGKQFGSGEASFQYNAAYVMSEVKREAQASGLYFFRLTGDAESFPGTVYSDTMLGGSGVLGMGSSVTIPAGADVTVATDPSGIHVDLFGYTLDIVQTSDNGKLGSITGGKSYTDVVRDNENVYSLWGNNSRATIDEDFEKWCNDILDVKNYSADFKLFVGSDANAKSQNFSATIGHIDRTGVTTAQNGVYQLVVEKGVLQTSKGDYTALIAQIADDYACSTAEAASIFQKSALYTAIINAMETCVNPLNQSGVCTEKAEWTNQLGGNNHWYDETSRTFVIRRFENKGNKICDVTASDKIDYQLAPTGSMSAGENANAGVGYQARWQVSIFFDQLRAAQVNDLLLGTGTYYKPQDGSSGFGASKNTYTILMDSIPVANADFLIPASSTQNFYN